MDHNKPRNTLGPTSSEATVEYIIDMIHQLSRLARTSGEEQIAIHLEAIIAARRAIAKDRSV